MLILQIVVGGCADAPSLTRRPPVYTTGERVSLPSRVRFDAVCIPQRVLKKKPRKQRSKKGYMRLGDMKPTLQSIPENEELFFE